MGFLQLLGVIGKKALEYTGTFVNGGINALLNMDSVNVNPYTQLRSMDDPPTAEEVKEEQLLLTSGHLSKATILENYANYIFLRRAVQMPFLINLKSTEVTLTLQITFLYSEKTGWKEIDGKQIRVIGANDHAYVHLIPSDFPGYSSLSKHNMFIINSVSVQSSQVSGTRTNTFVGFLPVSEDTGKYTNDELLTLTNGTSSNAETNVRFTLRALSGNMYNYVYDEKEKTYTKLEKESVTMNPDLVYYPNAIDGAYNLGEVLSFGTLVFVKRNLGIGEVGMSYQVDMSFVAFDMFNAARGEDSGSAFNYGTHSGYTHVTKLAKKVKK